jgi:hypothetical protein
VHIDSGPVRYWPRMSRDALARLFPDGKTVFIPADGQPMPGYEQARAEIEARGGQVQVAGGGFGIFSWLFGARGGGADDAEEESGGEATGVARGGRGGGGPQIQIAEAGPEAVAKAKRSLPTGPAYAGPVQPAPAPAASSQILEAGPEAVAKAKRNLPTGPAYASALDSAPTPPVKPQVVAALAEPNAASDASPSEPRNAFGAKSLAPVPPRRPTYLLLAVALADAWGEVPGAAAAAAADGSPPRGRARRRANAPGASGRSHPEVAGARDRRCVMADAVEQRAPPRRRGLAAAGHHARHRRRVGRRARAGGSSAGAEI